MKTQNVDRIFTFQAYRKEKKLHEESKGIVKKEIGNKTKERIFFSSTDGFLFCLRRLSCVLSFFFFSVFLYFCRVLTSRYCFRKKGNGRKKLRSSKLGVKVGQSDDRLQKEMHKLTGRSKEQLVTTTQQF